jgi:hypothetical protein
MSQSHCLAVSILPATPPARSQSSDAAFRGSSANASSCKRQGQLAQELRCVQKELQIANRRNEILKKALGILSQEPLRNDMPL